MVCFFLIVKLLHFNFVGFKTGSVQMLNLATTEQKVSSAPVTINSHKSELNCLAVNQQGTMIATASVKGTLIRIWDSVQVSCPYSYICSTAVDLQ